MPLTSFGEMVTAAPANDSRRDFRGNSGQFLAGLDAPGPITVEYVEDGHDSIRYLYEGIVLGEHDPVIYSGWYATPDLGALQLAYAKAFYRKHAHWLWPLAVAVIGVMVGLHKNGVMS